MKYKINTTLGIFQPTGESEEDVLILSGREIPFNRYNDSELRIWAEYTTIDGVDVVDIYRNNNIMFQFIVSPGLCVHNLPMIDDMHLTFYVNGNNIQESVDNFNESVKRAIANKYYGIDPINSDSTPGYSWEPTRYASRPIHVHTAGNFGNYTVTSDQLMGLDEITALYNEALRNEGQE